MERDFLDNPPTLKGRNYPVFVDYLTKIAVVIMDLLKKEGKTFCARHFYSSKRP